MCAYECVNANVPSKRRTNCARCVSDLANCTKETHSIKRILAPTALPHTPMVGLGSMEMLILCIYDIRDYWNSNVRTVRLIRNAHKSKLNGTYFLYFSSDDFSRKGIPDKNNIINVVNSGDKMPIHSIP